MKFFITISLILSSYLTSAQQKVKLKGCWREISFDDYFNKEEPKDSSIYWCFETDGVFVKEKYGIFQEPLKKYTIIDSTLFISHKDESDVFLLERFKIKKYSKKFLVLQLLEGSKDDKDVFLLIK